MAEKKKMAENITFLFQRQINQQSIRYSINQVKWIMQMWMMLELEVRHPGDNEFMEKSNLLEN